ncbi:hypothetical protein FNQ90_18595 [Streptomyces alkaliphilus]|uniref:GNAT family N-acetyltransferase n=1 Tax=Streptomyces alkaliphilus TaxID=1472722 RepID=A0A7W3TFU6_9ACTN|nr:hypothetical protein [Streptomyces alkaliphilus]
MTATSATPSTTPDELAVWTARPIRPADHPAVLAFFAEPDFHFRTAWPDTRAEWEVLDLLGEDTRLLLVDGVPAGLFEAEDIAGAHACHLQLHLRLTAHMPMSAWTTAYREVTRALCWQRELVRLTVMVGSWDTRGLAAARLAGLTEEGELPAVVMRDGGRHGTVFFSQIREPR